MSLTVAVIGTGPSGIYAGDGILRKNPGSHIDFIDRLPTPYGLVRYGVAPDHAGTKNVTRQYDRIMEKENVRLLGGVEVGRDVSLAELQKIYDAVIIATGAAEDRRLGIPGENLLGVYGSAAFVGWYNGHPDQRDLSPVPEHAKHAIVIGNGNVAIDIARVLIKEPSEMADSDICTHALEAIARAGLKSSTIAGRRGPEDASFTPPELRELGRLETAVPVIENAELPETLPSRYDSTTPDGRAKAKNLEIMHSFVEGEVNGKPKTIRILFYARPVEILGQDRVEAVRFEKTTVDAEGRVSGTGELFERPADLVVSAIGYRSIPLGGAPFDDKRGLLPNNEGHVVDNLYVVGWAKRGPSGTIPSNRSDSFKVAERVVADLGDASGKDGPVMLDTLLAERGVRTISFADWKKIDAAETAVAVPPAPRQKFTRIVEMLNAVDEG